MFDFNLIFLLLFFFFSRNRFFINLFKFIILFLRAAKLMENVDIDININIY